MNLREQELWCLGLNEQLVVLTEASLDLKHFQASKESQILNFVNTVVVMTTSTFFGFHLWSTD